MAVPLSFRKSAIVLKSAGQPNQLDVALALERPVRFTLCLTGLNLFSAALEPVSIWRRRTPVRAIPVSPNQGMESSNVDEIKIIRGRFGHPRCNERHGNN
jgi:hypothetical protein